MKTRQPCPMCDKLVPKSQIDYADYVDVDPRDGYEHHFHRVCWGHYQVSNRGLPDPEAMAAEAAREAEVVAPRRPGIVGLDGRELQN